MPFKASAECRHHIPKQRHRVTNTAAYDKALRQLGSLTVWFTEAAIAAWKAEPRTTRGGRPRYSDLAIATALTLRTLFRLALRQTEGLIGSIITLLGLDLAAPDHSTLSRRADTLAVLRPQSGKAPVLLLVDSTGLKLCGAGEWLLEKHGTRTRRAWRKLHIGVDADTGRIVAATLSTNDVSDASQVGALLDQITGPVASFTADGAYDQEGVYGDVTTRHSDAAVIVPPRCNAVPSDTAETAPTQRDRHLQDMAENGRITIFEINVDSYRRRAALDRKTRGTARPQAYATITPDIMYLPRSKFLILIAATSHPDCRATLADNVFAARAAVREGVGYGVLPLWAVQADLRNGTLFRLCPDWQPPIVVLSLAYPSGGHRPKRLTALLAFIKSELTRAGGLGIEFIDATGARSSIRTAPGMTLPDVGDNGLGSGRRSRSRE